jgi:phosphohistidine phosphatase
MELILWRHAEAEPGGPDTPDAKRALTAKGLKQAAKTGEWLDRHLPDSCRVLASPTIRTVQTVEALGRKFKTHAALAPDSTAEAILDAAHWPNNREPVLIVGHQPTLGQVMSLLIAGVQQEWTLRKGGICWIAQKADGETDAIYLKAVLSPELVGK